MKILTIIFFLLVFCCSCAGTPNYYRDNNCHQRIERHYDKDGKFIGSTQGPIECDRHK